MLHGSSSCLITTAPCEPHPTHLDTFQCTLYTCVACGTRLYFCTVVFTLFTLRRQCRDQYSYNQSRTSSQKRAPLVHFHRPLRLRIGRGRGRSLVGLSRGFGGSSIVPRLRSLRFRICSLWTASVEHADVHPAVFLTPRAFHSGVSGLLRDSDSRSSRWSRLSVYLFALRLSSTEAPRLHLSRPFLSCPKP